MLAAVDVGEKRMAVKNLGEDRFYGRLGCDNSGRETPTKHGMVGSGRGQGGDGTGECVCGREFRRNGEIACSLAHPPFPQCRRLGEAVEYACAVVHVGDHGVAEE